MIIKRMKLGEMLIEARKIKPEELRHALELQLKTHRRLGEVLVELGYIDQETLVSFLSDQLQIPRIDLSDTEIEKGALEQLPQDYCTKNLVCPYRLEGNKLHVCIADPMNIFLIDEIEHRTGRKVQTYLETPGAIRSVLDRCYRGSEPHPVPTVECPDDKDTSPHVDVSGVGPRKIESSMTALARQLIARGLTANASSIHVEPGEHGLRVRYRVDGVLRELLEVPQPVLKSASDLTDQLKLMAGMDPETTGAFQDGTIRVTRGDEALDAHVSIMPVATGERICIRFCAARPELEELGFSERDLKLFARLGAPPHGLLLVTGPSGSGKTTTLYAALNHVSDAGKSICTVESSIAHPNPEFGQTRVRPSLGLTFASCLEAILHQDPDVLLVGDVGEARTAELTVESALSGRLVLAALRVGSAASAVTRLIDLGVDPRMLASTLLGIVSQRLCRTLCANCRKPVDPETEIRVFAQERLKMDLSGRKTYVRGECASCRNTGYSGRCGLYEILENTDELRQQILTRAGTETIACSARTRGLWTMVEDGYLKVLQGITTLDEVRRVAG